MIVAGIDYSLTSPAICVHNGTKWDYKNCKFFYLTGSKKSIMEDHPFYGTLYPDWNCPQDRHDRISGWSMEILEKEGVDKAVIEGYSYGSSKGLVFNIAENTSILKFKMWQSKIPFDIIAPTAIKKYATGKGNANKESMNDEFEAANNIGVKQIMKLTDKQWNPSSDVIDAYYMAKYCLDES